MYIRELSWVYCICHKVYCRGHDVLQEPHLGVLDLESVVLHMPSCTSGVSLGVLYLPIGVLHMPPCTSEASLGCTAVAIKCTAEAIMYFRSLTWVCCICHQVYCILYHVNQEPLLVYCICQEVYCICHHVHQEPHLGVLHLESSVLYMPSCTSGAALGVLHLPSDVLQRP